MSAALLPSNANGPRVDRYHRHELPGKHWTSCRGCPSLRVFDWHYYYCRALGDQRHPDAWNAGWYRLGNVVWSEEHPPACYLPTVDEDSRTPPPAPRRRDYIRIPA